MASPIGSLWKRYEKWLRLMTLVHHAGKEICYKLLFTKRKLPTDGSSLYHFLKISEQRIKPDKSQKLVLYPQNQHTDSANFDIPLYTKIIHGLFGLHYSKLVGDVRMLRNKMFHQGNAELTEKKFKDLWEEASEVLESHEFDMNSVAGLKECSFDQLREYKEPVRSCIEGFIQGNKESLLFCFFRYLFFLIHWKG